MDLENFDFKSYLIKVGLEEKYAGMVTVIETLKTKLKEIKEDDEFEIKDNGIYYKEGIIRLDNGKLRVAKNSFFTEKNDLYVYIEDEFSRYKITVLDEYGAVQKIIYSKKHSLAEEYEKTERIYEFETPFIEFLVTYNDENIVEEYIADHGDPISLRQNTKSFEENYNYYTRKYPYLKKWYEDRYKIDGKDIKKYSEELRERQNDLTIRLLKEQIERFEKYIEEAKNREKEYDEKFSNMYNELKKGNIIKKILYRPVIRIINEEFSRIDEKEEYVIDSQDEKLQIDHEKIDKDYTEPLSEKEKEVEKLKNAITDKKVELLEVEKKIGTLIKKIEIIKLKTENIGE